LRQDTLTPALSREHILFGDVGDGPGALHLVGVSGVGHVHAKVADQ